MHGTYIGFDTSDPRVHIKMSCSESSVPGGGGLQSTLTLCSPVGSAASSSKQHAEPPTSRGQPRGQLPDRSLGEEAGWFGAALSEPVLEASPSSPSSRARERHGVRDTPACPLPEYGDLGVNCRLRTSARLLTNPTTSGNPNEKRVSNMENSFDDVSCLSPQNLGSSSPGKKQSKENTITVSGSRRVPTGRVASWGFWPPLGCSHGNTDRVEAMPSLESGKFQSLDVAEVTP